MKIQSSKIEKVYITELDHLDPVTVILEDIEPRKGKIIIECYGKSWSAYWGGMGNRTIAEFFCSCDEQYIAGNLDGGLRSYIPDFESFGDVFKQRLLQMRLYNEIDHDEAFDMCRIHHEEIAACESHDGLHQHDRVLSRVLGEEWWYEIPDRPNPDYQYLCRIIKAVQMALRSMSAAEAA